ncbi:DUF2110 family protein [Candidatus Bathyarchaeota archaeon]|nr:MAG: DUF2110 family protein [Candidatus Bathyarchaeota archaeon]
MVEEWQIATLAEKIPPQVLRQGSQFIARALAEKANGLEMESDFGQQGQWLQVRARGEDADAFLNLLKQEYGEASVSRSSLEKWNIVRGFVAGAGRIGYGVYVDIGIQEPRPKDALYPLHRMRAQLADGEPKSAREILDANALVDFVPLRMIVTELEGENISVELDDVARDNLVSWRKYPFDRVIVVGADKAFVENAVRASGLQGDVVKVESLSLFVQSVLCKIGTEAPGVIAKIGNRLRGVGLKSYRTPTNL